MKTLLFSPLKIRELNFKNRVVMSPMCQYSAQEGFANQWHFAHWGARAQGGVGAIIIEATGVSPEGRISPGCLGLWNQAQAECLRGPLEFLKQQGVAVGIQLAHAGRKASSKVAWEGGGPLSPQEGAWTCWAPSAIPYKAGQPVPVEMTEKMITEAVSQFVAAAQRALDVGIQFVELHMAHGYLMHQFLSPLSNARRDQFGGSLENRCRFPLMVAEAVRKVWPEHLPLFVRISATDWADGGWDLEQSTYLCQELKKRGVDLIDVSSGGLVPHQKITVGPGYQVPLSEALRQKTGIQTGAVGMITEPLQAEAILQNGKADMIILGRELLRNPYWALNAAQALGEKLSWPKQYERAAP